VSTVKLLPNKTVAITPSSPYFPIYHMRTDEDAGVLFLPPDHIWRWDEEGWHGYRQQPGSEGLYTYYQFLDDGTFLFHACCPGKQIYTGTWHYVE
jgi:hypothetical protein